MSALSFRLTALKFNKDLLTGLTEYSSKYIIVGLHYSLDYNIFILIPQFGYTAAIDNKICKRNGTLAHSSSLFSPKGRFHGVVIMQLQCGQNLNRHNSDISLNCIIAFLFNAKSLKFIAYWSLNATGCMISNVRW